MTIETFHTYQTDLALAPGWYYRIDPQADPVGPFKTETEAEKARPVIFWRNTDRYMAEPEVYDRLNRLWCGLFMTALPMDPYHAEFARALAAGEIVQIEQFQNRRIAP